MCINLVRLDDTYDLFFEMPNSYIVGYVQDKDEDEAFSMFSKRNSICITPNEVSLSSILSASANLQAVVKRKTNSLSFG